jgi:hypothetical protein
LPAISSRLEIAKVATNPTAMLATSAPMIDATRCRSPKAGELDQRWILVQPTRARRPAIA